MSGKQQAAAITLQRPPQPLTTSALESATKPIMDLLGLPGLGDVVSVHITDTKVTLVVVPRHRGRKQHDSRVRVVYPVAYDGEEGEA